VFGPILYRLGYGRKAWPEGNGERFICCAPHSNGDWFELPAKLAQGLEDAWEKIESELKDLKKYAVGNVFDAFKNELHDQVLEVLEIDLSAAKRATLAKLKKKRG
jgi:hypothetical protein